MVDRVRAASFGPPGAFHKLNFSTAGTLEDKIGSFDDEWRNAMIQPIGADLEFRVDGTTVTSGNGIVIADGECWVFENQKDLLEQASFLGGTDVRVHLFH